MTDINSNHEEHQHNLPPADEAANVHSLDQARILTLMELLYFAYRDFTADCDDILESIHFGRAHHRVIHFVHRYPGLRVADLLKILKITKQSLARVLKQLIDEGYIFQKPGSKDRRERHLYTTKNGHELAEKLATPQIEHIRRAIKSLNPDDSIIIEDFLFSLIQQPNRHDVITLIGEDAALFHPKRQDRERDTQENHD